MDNKTIEELGLFKRVTLLLGIVITENPNIRDDYGIRFVVQCDNCKNKWNIDKFTTDEADVIKNGFANGTQLPEAICQKCSSSPINN
jgi:hypothetical protein